MSNRKAVLLLGVLNCLNINCPTIGATESTCCTDSDHSLVTSCSIVIVDAGFTTLPYRQRNTTHNPETVVENPIDFGLRAIATEIETEHILVRTGLIAPASLAHTPTLIRMDAMFQIPESGEETGIDFSDQSSSTSDHHYPLLEISGQEETLRRCPSVHFP